MVHNWVWIFTICTSTVLGILYIRNLNNVSFRSWNSSSFYAHEIYSIVMSCHEFHRLCIQGQMLAKPKTEWGRGFPNKVSWSGVAIRYMHIILPPELGCVFLIEKYIIPRILSLLPRYECLWVFVLITTSLWHPRNVKVVSPRADLKVINS